MCTKYLTLHTSKYGVMRVTVSVEEVARSDQVRFTGAFQGVGNGPVVDLVSGSMNALQQSITLYMGVLCPFCTYISLSRNKSPP